MQISFEIIPGNMSFAGGYFARKLYPSFIVSFLEPFSAQEVALRFSRTIQTICRYERVMCGQMLTYR